MNTASQHAFAVVLAGGSGTRLWPTSRDNTPKQFLKLGGDRTLMQQSVDRILEIIPTERIIVVTNAKYVEAVRAQLPELPEANIIAEPAKRDTALAMALGAVIAKHRDPEAIIVNVASDAALGDEAVYRRVISSVVELASRKEHLFTIGITPTGPNVNFGYIQSGEKVDEINGYPVMAVKSFKEKPDLATAQNFLAAGNYFWNANMYTWHADTILAAFEQYQPKTFGLLQQIAAALDTPEFESVLTSTYEQADKVPIDIAISEQAQNLRLIPGTFGWDDIGLWSTVFDLGKKDEFGNVIVRDSAEVTPIVTLESKNNLVATNRRLIALQGVEDFVIIDSNDVLLIMPRSKASEVKKVVQQLEAQGMQEYL